MELLRPADVGALLAALRSGAVPLGGGAGLMSAAFADAWGRITADLGGLGLDRAVDGRVGAMVPLSRMAASCAGRPAIAQAVAATGHPGVRRLITVGGVLGARSPRADLPVALAASGATVSVLDAADGTVRELSPLDLWTLPGPFAVLSVDLGPAAPGVYRRFTGHQTIAPSLVSVAAVRRPDGGITVCVGAGLPRPRLVEPDRLPGPDELLDDGEASAGYRHRIMRLLVAEACEALTTGPAGLPSGPQRAAAPLGDGPTCAGPRADGPTCAAPGTDVVVDGTARPVPDGSRPTDSLAWWLRDHGHRAVKVGCEEGTCGACTVSLNGEPVPSCLVPVARLRAGDRVDTAATLADRPAGRAVIGALAEAAAVQCGFCTPGVLVSCGSWMDRHGGLPADEDDIRDLLAGHLCRCGGLAAAAHVLRGVCPADTETDADAAAIPDADADADTDTATGADDRREVTA
ncbi:2Fe-2S iron-sulfur cluster-binding protein [Kitasatospora sp. NPDC097691]|uniref:2Fe-2S iron-sulfur cluster-binding protein n=1 Tax=Kitasatospora sp. NPDC097691 TaxID=3157231 RepID=UPI00331CFA4B